MKTLELFESLDAAEIQNPCATQSIRFTRESPLKRANRRIKELLIAKHVLVLAFSSGKDSSALVCITLACAVDLQEAGHSLPPIIITHSSTGIENPEIDRLARAELQKMETFAAIHSLNLKVLIGEPELNVTWPVRVIGGRALPSYPNSRADCSQDLKIACNRRLLKRAISEIENASQWQSSVIMTGVRIGESASRDRRIEGRNEVAEGIWKNEHGDLRASPILDFEVDDVWEVLGLAAAGAIKSYSDFEKTMDIYRSAGGSSCVIVADMKSAAYSKPCSARTGCWACTRVGADQSAEEMIKSDPQRYAHLQPLNRLRNWLANTQYDWSLRQYVGRTIAKDGYIEIVADTFSPDTLRRLLIYTLSAEHLSGVPIINLQQLIAIDARWSMYGLFPPFSALKIYLDLQATQAWEEAPIVDLHPATPVPRIGRIYVGNNWTEITGLRSVAGLRDSSMEMFGFECGVDYKTLPNGALVCNYDEGEGFEVDWDGAADFLTFMAEDYIDQYCKPDCQDWTWGYKTYLRLGILSIGKGQARTNDEILRRSQWRQEHELHGQRSVEELDARCDVHYPRQQSLI